jgi:hypothetical protein
MTFLENARMEREAPISFGRQGHLASMDERVKEEMIMAAPVLVAMVQAVADHNWLKN